MEGLPFRLVAILILAAAILSIAFLQLSTFTEFTQRKQFADDVVNVANAMRALTAGGDYGSFTRVRLRIPQGSSAAFDNSTNLFVVHFYGERREYAIPGRLVLSRFYGPAEYQLVMYYGVPSNQSDPLVVAIR
ncbi:hypothetical protein HY571_02835 [Candidatus Micrarchaeota archaeon]|nr:hypothetical protein [Candidatus Micrarchaeota archaeon]